MLEIFVILLTRCGITTCEFLTGVPQGSTLSVHIANLIIWVKHRVMRLNESLQLSPRRNAFRFRVWDSG